MPARTDHEAVQHMLEYAHEAVGMLGGRSREELRVDHLRDLALQQLISMIGHAARAVSAERRARLAQIPWQRAIVMGDRMVYGFDTVDHAVVWTHVAEDLPRLIAALEELTPGDPW